jgi:hypothetical protein
MWATLIVTVLVGFGSAALTRAIVNDTIMDQPREWVAAKHEWLEKLVTCPWCVSFWATGIVGLAAWWQWLWIGPVGLLAAWALGKLVYWWTEALAAAAVPD